MSTQTETITVKGLKTVLRKAKKPLTETKKTYIRWFYSSHKAKDPTDKRLKPVLQNKRVFIVEDSEVSEAAVKKEVHDLLFEAYKSNDRVIHAYIGNDFVALNIYDRGRRPTENERIASKIESNKKTIEALKERIIGLERANIRLEKEIEERTANGFADSTAIV